MLGNQQFSGEHNPLATSSETTAKGKRVRESGPEMLRLVAMFMILLLHANFRAFGVPETATLDTGGVVRVLAEQICIVSVCCFVLISGWFGIRPSVKSIGGLLTQVFTYMALFTAILCVCYHQLIVDYIIQTILVGYSYWFIGAYLTLCALAPALNAFIEKASRRELKLTIIFFYAALFMYGWLWEDAIGVVRGYSAIAFIGLYLLARYLKIYRPSFTLHSPRYYLVWFVSLSAISVIGVIAYNVVMHTESIPWPNYIQPWVIVCSVALTLAFVQMHWQSRTVNWLASSSLAVYLIHCHPALLPQYSKAVIALYDWTVSVCHCENVLTQEAIYALLLLVGLLALMLVCILIDKLRLRLTPTERITNALQRALQCIK